MLRFRPCSSAILRSCRLFSALPNTGVGAVAEPLPDDGPSVDVLEPSSEQHHQLLSIQWNNHSKSVLVPAPWLWVQNAKHIQQGSGQKLETSLSFYGRQAKIVDAAWEPQMKKEGSDEESWSAPPPLGSLHPMTEMYKGIEDEGDDTALSEWWLRVEWESLSASDSKVKQSSALYHGNWLHRMLCASSSRSKQHQRSAMTLANTALRASTHLDRIPYATVVQGDDADTSLCRTLHAIFQRGAVLVTQTDVPDENDDDASPVAQLGRRLSGGDLSHGYLYNPVFHVRTLPHANNIAYTPVALPPHQDLAYYESPPGLQLLHCVTNDTGGSNSGASTLVDGLQAAETLRSLAPDLFYVLTRVSATFMKQREEADMVYRRPHIRLGGSDGETVVSVHWSPPFEGPVVLDQSEDASVCSTMQEYYTAYAAFTRLVDASQPRNERLLPQLSSSLEQQLTDYAQAMTWEYVLEPGTTLVFNNLRMLHGRTALRTRASSRHLMGCYTNIDESLSQYRRLRRQRQTNGALMMIPMVGNGSDALVL